MKEFYIKERMRRPHISDWSSEIGNIERMEARRKDILEMMKNADEPRSRKYKLSWGG